MISNSPQGRPNQAFTLIEVIVSLGICAFTVVAVAGSLAAITKSGSEIAPRTKAVQLAGAINLELVRMRDGLAGDDSRIRLDAMADLIPSSNGEESLRLVASPDGSRIIMEQKADDPVTGLAPRDRYFLIEVRRQPGALAYRTGAGFLALTTTVRWPYQLPAGPGPFDARPADLAQTSRVILNSALPP